MGTSMKKNPSGRDARRKGGREGGRDGGREVREGGEGSRDLLQAFWGEVGENFHPFTFPPFLPPSLLPSHLCLLHGNATFLQHYPTRLRALPPSLSLSLPPVQEAGRRGRGSGSHQRWI